MDDFRVYQKSEVDKFADIFYQSENQSAGDLGKLQGQLRPAVDRYEVLEVEKQDIFKSTLASFNRVYAYITQVCRLFDKDIHRFSIYSKFLYTILSSAIGALTNPNKLQKTFKSVNRSKITATTITKYIEYLEDAFLIEEAVRYDIKGKSYIGTPLKYYFMDMGLRNARINYRQIEITYSMENVIYNELRMRGFSVDVGNLTIVENGKDGKAVKKQLEVDFICNKGSKKYYIQSAYQLGTEEKLAQEIRPFLKINDSFKKIVITSDTPKPCYTDEGILMMNVYDFLLIPEMIDL